MKEQPNVRHGPDHPRLGTTTDHQGKTHSNGVSLHRTPTWAWSYHLERYHRSLHLVLEGICESRGLSNLTPSRSRLFKLMGREKVWGGAAASTSIYGGWHTQMRARREGRARSGIYDQEVILKLLTFKHKTRTVFTSQTPPRRDHHGNSHSWFILIKLRFKLSTTGH